MQSYTSDCVVAIFTHCRLLTARRHRHIINANVRTSDRIHSSQWSKHGNNPPGNHQRSGQTGWCQLPDRVKAVERSGQAFTCHRGSHLERRSRVKLPATSPGAQPALAPKPHHRLFLAAFYSRSSQSNPRYAPPEHVNGCRGTRLSPALLCATG